MNINGLTIKILHLENQLYDAELVEKHLIKAGLQFERLLVNNKLDFIAAFTDFSPDIILSDHFLNEFNSDDALRLCAVHHVSAPFILVSADELEEYTIKILKEGAYDYVQKANLKRLPSV